MNRSTLIFTSVILLVTSLHFAQPLPVEIINTTNGLSNNKILYIFQDSYGLMWIGTEYGLNRYDGYNFKIYRNNPDDPQSINSNIIWWIVEDEEKNLWISTGEGVSKYIRAKNIFKNYDFFGDYYSSVAIYIDSKKNIWAAHETENINKYNKETDTWEKPKLIFDSTKTYGSPAQIMKIVEDKDEKLWIASISYGLMWYDEKEKVFRQAEIKYEDGITDFTNYENMMTDLFPDSTGVIWITSTKGVHKYDPTLKKLKTLQKYTFEVPNNAETGTNSISQDREGNIWITHDFNGLLKFDGITHNYKRITITGQMYSKEGISNIVLTKKLWDNSGILWIGTFRDGLIKYDPNKKIFKQYVHNENDHNSISNTAVLSLIESKIYPEVVYVGTKKGSLNLFDSKTNSFSKIPITFHNGIISSSVRSILEEEDGTLWLGTVGDGLLKMNPQRQITKRFIPDSSNINSISVDRVRVIRKDLSGNLWIGTFNNGLNYFDTEKKSFKNFNKEFNRYSQKIIDLINKKIDDDSDKAKIIKVGDLQKLSSEFEVNNQGDYLIVTAGEGGVGDPLMWDYGWIEDSNEKIIWDSKKFALTNYLGGVANNRIKVEILNLNPGNYSLKYESDGGYSFGNWNETPPDEPEFWGIRIFEIDDVNKLKTIKKLLIENEKNFGINGTNIKDIHITKDNVVWVGTYQHGLNKINLVENNVRTYLFGHTINTEGSRFTINGIHEDHEGILWLATSRGLIEFDPKIETFKYFRDQDGLPTNVIHSILPGENKELWLSTLNGLSNMKRDIAGKPTFVNYGIEDGLGGMDFTSLVALKSNNGKYYFGGNHGLNEFDSEKSISNPPNLYLSDFKISNVSFSEIFEDSLIETSLMDLENLSLNHNQNDLSFEFTALHFSNPKKNKYAHKLEGYENDWIYDNSRIATYTNLDPGKYAFKFKGSNNEGIWNEKGKSISFIISPPFWQTWWAYLGYGFIFLGAFYGVDRVQKRKLLRKAKERMKIQASEHRAEAAELQAKLVQAENERKSKELEEARQLQLSMLPKELPKLPNLEISVYMKTATEVGGDYYDFSFKRDGSLNICLGDATGHGMKAGTLVSMIKALFTANSVDKSISEFFSSSNEALKNSKLDKMLMAFAMVNINKNKIQIINAGIPPVFIFRKEKEIIEEVKINGLPLGAMKNSKYKIYEGELSEGDAILMLSDGFPELQNNKDEMYGYERAVRLFKDIGDHSSEEIISKLKEAGSEWVNDNEPDDDVTFFVIKVK